MSEQIVSLEQLCKVLADAVARSDELLSQFERSGDHAAFTYRIDGDAPQSLRSIPGEMLRERHRYSIGELDFSVLCCIETRTVGSETQTVLILRIPGWWGRLGRRPAYRRLQIRVSPQGTTLKLHPVSGRRVPKGGSPWILALSPEQYAMLTIDTAGDDGADIAKDAPGNRSAKLFAVSKIAAALRRWFSFH